MDATSPFRSRAWPDAGPRSSTSRRRWALLAGLLAIPAALVVLGVPSAWPLLAVPIVAAAPLLGMNGLAVAAAASAATIALASGSESVRGPQLAIGLIGFLAAGSLVAAGSAARERELARASALGMSDRLTGLHNYGFLTDVLPRECRRAARYDQPLSLVVLDLDGFKEFNDRHGHVTGNRLLAAVGQTIGANARHSDLPARFGGEEFVVIVPGPADEAREAADRLREAIRGARVSIEGGEGGVSASAGVAQYDAGVDGDWQALLGRADAALYESKRAGRDRTTVGTPEEPLREAA